MEGRRVRGTPRKRNPLYDLFLCLIAAVFVLLIVVVVLGVKLHAAQKALDAFNAQIELPQEEPAQDPLTDGDTTEPAQPEKDTEPTDSDTEENKQEPPKQEDTKQDPKPEQTESRKVGSLDLTNHKEVQVLPKSTYSAASTRYTSDGVNLRGGPGTSYNKIMLVSKATAVKEYAKSGDWAFVGVGNKYGWIKSEYLALEAPKAEATSGSLKKTK